MRSRRAPTASQHTARNLDPWQCEATVHMIRSRNRLTILQVAQTARSVQKFPKNG